MFAVLCTDGELDLNAVRNECVPGKWVPVFVYKVNADDSPIVPVFRDAITAKKFAKRNLPKNWMLGAVELTDRDIEWIKEKEWIIKEMTYPHKVDNYHCGFEILEFEVVPDFRTSR